MPFKLFSLALAILALSAFSGAVIIVDLDDRNTPPIIYTGTWKQVVNQVLNGSISNYYDGTNSHTQTPGESASLTFAGVQLTYWADRDASCANINVTLDGISTIVGAYNPVFLGQQVLFDVSGLENKTHTFTVTHAGVAGQYLNVDHIQYAYLPPVAPSSTPGATDPPSKESKSSTNLAGVIAGSVIGGVALSLITVGAFFFLRRRAKKGKQYKNSGVGAGGNRSDPDHPNRPFTPGTYDYAPTHTQFTSEMTPSMYAQPTMNDGGSIYANTGLQPAHRAPAPTHWSGYTGGDHEIVSPSPRTPPPQYPA